MHSPRAGWFRAAALLTPRVGCSASCRVVLGGLLVLGGGCGDDVETVRRPPIVWEGEHVEIGTDLDLDAWCPGTLTRLDRYTGAVKELFEAPADHLATYYLYPPPISDHDVCPEGALGCAVDDAAFTTDLLDTHEIVHAVSWAHGYMAPFFEEGTASYWGYSPTADFRGLDIREVLDIQWSDRIGNRGYALAAHFTSYLIHLHGMKPYLALHRGTSWGQSREDFEAAFEQALGLTLDEAIDDYEEQWSYCDVESTRSSFYECSQPAIALPPGELMQFDLDISCADPEVIGPSTLISSDGVPRIWRDLTIEIEGNQHIVFFDVPALGEPNSVVVEIKRCDTDCREVVFNRRQLIPDGTPETYPNYFTFSMLPGTYVMRVSRAADDPGPVSFRIQ